MSKTYTRASSMCLSPKMRRKKKDKKKDKKQETKEVPFVNIQAQIGLVPDRYTYAHVKCGGGQECWKKDD